MGSLLSTQFHTRTNVISICLGCGGDWLLESFIIERRMTLKRYCHLHIRFG